jgi:radical SAM protein with 4Fe4S-binding SPASM domain
MKKAPDYIQFYPTLRCNRSCNFCFNRPLPPMPDMTAQDYISMLQKLEKLSVKTLDIIGGEPTLHQDIVLFVREASQRGMRVTISSNGSKIETLKEIQQTGNGVSIGVSINDQGSLRQLESFIHQAQPVVKTVYGSSADLVLIAEIVMRNPKKFYLIYRDVMGNGELDKAIPFYQFMSTAQQKFYAASKISTIYCSGFLPEVKEHPELAGARCPAGTTKLGVMPDGSVYPCNLFFGRKEFLLGNILNDPFEAIWNHQLLDFFRTFTGNKCLRKKCELYAECHGGCPAHALALTGDIAAPDPRCV